MTDIELDESQRAVATADPRDRLVVLAGAGQGKTEVVAERLVHLLDEGLSSGEILVLSFSRAAVSAVRRRLRDRGEAGRVTVRTFDSFAAALLGEIGEDVTGMSFEERIRAATKSLLDGESFDDLLERRHLIVDEVQDLVGDRAEFVAGVLSTLEPEVGFTLLGDPLQAIYDWQLDESSSDLDSGGLIDRALTEFGAHKMHLARDYRARSREARAAVDIGVALRGRRPDTGFLASMKEFLDKLPPIVDLDDLVRAVPKWHGSTVVLCRTNGTVLRIADRLRTTGVRCSVAGARGTTTPAWLAGFADRAPTSLLRRDEVTEILASVPGAPDPVEAWGLLKETERWTRAPRELDLARLHARLVRGDVPPDLSDRSPEDLVVSTVHRAKGLEFDHAVVVAGDSWSDGDREDDAAEARALFVAVTRARDRIAVAVPPASGGMLHDRHSGRWVRTGYRSKDRWKTYGIEFQPTDVDCVVPTCGAGSDAVGVMPPVPGTGDGGRGRLLDPDADTPRYR